MNPDLEKQLAEFRHLRDKGLLSEAAYEAAVSALTASHQTNVQSDAAAAVGDKATAVAGRGAKARDVAGPIITGDYNTIEHILNVYLQAPGQPASDKDAFALALDRYLGWVENRYGRLNLRGVEQREQQILSLTLDDVYVSLAVQIQAERKRGHMTRQQLPPEEERARQIDMNHLLALSNRLVITGGPGSGKTTYLHIIATALALALRTGNAELVQKHLGLRQALPLPIVVPLSEYNQYRQQHRQARNPRQGTLISFISHHLIRQHAMIGLPADFFERLLLQGQACILLLDGLDEVANDRERLLVRQAVEDLAHNAGIRHCIVTSRTRAYQGEAVLPESFRVAAVQPMTEAQTNALTAHWCAAVYDELEVATETNSLQKAIAALEGLREARREPRLVDTPLMVTIVAIVHYNQRRLPDQRAELYEKCVEVLLAEGYKPASEATFALADWGGTVTEKRGLLAFLAYQMMNAGAEAGRAVEEGQLRQWLHPRLMRKWGEAEAGPRLAAFIQAMRERGSLLDERGGLYQFTHLTFQEFLCATYLAETVRQVEKIVAFWLDEGRVRQAWWRETILLAVGYLSLKSEETALALLQSLLVQPLADDGGLAAAELAGAAFLELESKNEAMKAGLATRLVVLLTSPSLTATPALRMLAGDTLGRLGDPRPGVGTLEPEMINIPAGSFLMGEERHEIHLETFAIARYPITNAQFRYFVEDGGYTMKWRQCWTEAGWQDRSDDETPYFWDDNRFDQSNQPVVGVTWYAAVAYCRWLSQKMGKSYRLPIEAEWERAARHTDGREYLWGQQEPRAMMTNFKPTGLERPTAVGIFPQDTAVCGIQDMAGNVNEWCQTRWSNESQREYTLPYKLDDGREKLEGDNDVWRVIRGGSYYDDVEWLRCAFRLGGSPGYWFNYLGFRVVVVPHFSTTSGL